MDASQVEGRSGGEAVSNNLWFLHVLPFIEEDGGEVMHGPVVHPRDLLLWIVMHPRQRVVGAREALFPGWQCSHIVLKILLVQQHKQM